jgi:hypothetical protein
MKKNIVLSIKMSNIDLPRSLGRESCPRPHLKQKCATLSRALRTVDSWGRWDAEEGHGDPS